MRKAVTLAQDAGLKVIMTLHDAIYIEAMVDEWNAGDLLAECMQEAFGSFFPEVPSKDKTVGLDGNVWGPDLEDGQFRCNNMDLGLVKCQQIYVDERSAVEYEPY